MALFHSALHTEPLPHFYTCGLAALYNCNMAVTGILLKHSLHMPMSVTRFSSPVVCLFIRMISQKPNLTYKCSTISPGNPLFWGQKIKNQGQSHKQCRCGSLHSCECWLLLVVFLFGRQQCSRVERWNSELEDPHSIAFVLHLLFTIC